MGHFFLYLLAALLLGAGPARAMRPLASVVVPSGTVTTFTGAPNKGSGATTTYNNNFYQRIDIQSGGVGVFNDGENVGSYTTYVPAAPSGGRSTNPLATAATGTNVVPMGQAFFVYNPTVGTQGRVAFTTQYTIRSYSAAVAGTPVQRTTAETRPYLRLALQDAAATRVHSTLVYFDGAATPGFDGDYDAAYLPGPGQPVSLTTTTAGQEYAINALPTLAAADVTVPLTLTALAAGSYTLQVAELENLPAGTHAYLLDATAGTRQELTATTSLAVALAASTPVAGRYSVLFSRTNAPLGTVPTALAALVTLYPNPASHTATLRLPAALRAGQSVAVRVLDALGRVAATATQPATADELTLSLDGLAPGFYTVQAQAAGGTVSRRLTVQ